MRQILANEITSAVARLCIKACVHVAPDIKNFMQDAVENETGTANQVLNDMLKNQEIAAQTGLPICQDTGMAVVFLDIGQDMHIVGDIASAVNAGVAQGYTEGYLRKSVIDDPLNRKNTGDNTPAVIHYNIIPGDKLKITVCPKGFGSENMSRLTMLTPSAGLAGIENFVIETVRLADANACPPIIVGVGIGGTFDYAAKMAKQALLRKVGSVHKDPMYAKIEAGLLKKINATGIGPAGFGGETTAMAVFINAFATHIAGLPVAVNLGCHVNRHEEEIL